MWKAGIVGLLFSFFPSAVCLADVATINPSQWGTLIQVAGAYPTQQMSNGQGDIYVGVTKQGQILRGLIEFNIAQYIPAGSTITGVSLTMADVSGLNGNQTINLHDVAQAWTQGTSNVGGGGGARPQITMLPGTIAPITRRLPRQVRQWTNGREFQFHG